MAAVEYYDRQPHQAIGPGANYLPNWEIWIEPHTTQAPGVQAAPRELPAHTPARDTNSPPCTTVPAASIPLQRAAHVFADLITHIFGSARYPYPSPRSAWQKTLPAYIASVLSASALPLPVALSAVAILLRYKDAVPYSVAYGDDAARLFLAAHIVAAKLAGAPPRGVQGWWRVGGGRFGCAEIGRMERELCRVLRWDILPDRATYAWLARMVRAACEGRRRGLDLDGSGGGEAWAGGGCGGREGDVSEDDEDWDEDWDEDASARHHRLHPPPPAYSASAHDTAVVEAPPARASPYSVVRPAQGRTPADIEDRMRLARIFAAPAAPTRVFSVRRGVSVAQTQGQAAMYAGAGAGGEEAGYMTVLKERMLQIVLRKPRVPN